MDSEEDETVLRITAQYVADVQAGKQLAIASYIERCPQYADAILDFIFYYHSIEVNLAEATYLATDGQELRQWHQNKVADAKERYMVSSEEVSGIHQQIEE